MDPTQGHASGAVTTLRLSASETVPVLREFAEGLVVGLLGSSLRLETHDDFVRVFGPGTSGAVAVRIAPVGHGLATVSVEGTVDGRPNLAGELRDRLVRVAMRRATPPPADAYCHALGFGRECDRRKGHTGHHLSVAETPVAWTSDGGATVEYESRFVIEDLLDRIRTLESAVARSEARPSSAVLPSPPLARPLDRPGTERPRPLPSGPTRPRARARARSARSSKSS
ncbi:MAG TPA: hypothetical protein VMG36_02150 [Thermoplasmata archaeon]|nr:hypothetical protein [Thermoplasmata archaeon]